MGKIVMTPAPTTPDLLPFEDASATRQDRRMENVPDLYRTTHERLAVELALHMDDAADIFARYNYTPEQAASLVESPAFLALLERVTKEVRESGLSFKAKIKAVAEDLIPTAYEIATDPNQSAAVRKDIIVWAAKLAGHEPKERDEGKGTGSGLTLTIQFAGSPPQQVVSGQEPLTIDQS